MLMNATAIGAHSYVSQNNSLVLGSINGVNGATADVNVGIGTSSPSHLLHIKANSSHAGLTQIFLEESEEDYVRMRFQNTVASRYWEVGSLPQTNNADASLNFYYNNFGTVLALKGDGKAGFNNPSPHAKTTVQITGSASAGTTPLMLDNIKEYADNSAAVSAGLPIGAIYRTGDLLKIVH